MASKAEISRVQSLIERFNAGKTAYNPEFLTAHYVVVDEGSGDYAIEIREDEDLVETFSDLDEFANWILDSESGYVD